MFSFSNNRSPEGKYISLSADSIRPNPYQPRKIFNEADLATLSLSIARHGVIQPLIVRKVSGGYELVAGERRLRAAKMAGVTVLPCIVLRIDGEQSSLYALIENLQRADLDFFEEALGYRQLIDAFGMTQESIAQRVGRSQSSVANKLRLLKLSAPCIGKIREAGLSERHARALLRLDEGLREEALDVVIENDFNVVRTEEYIESLAAKAQLKLVNRPLPRPIIKDIRFFFNSVDRAVELINQAGVSALCEREELDDAYKITIVVPKRK